MLVRIRELWRYREMLRNLVAKELQARYKGSYLGFLWTFFNPLLMLVVYSTVFSFIMRSDIKNYAMFLFVTLLPWNYMVNAIIQGTGSLVQNGALIKKVYFPREVLPMSVVFANLVNYLLSLMILIPALIIFKIKLTVALVAFPAVLLVQTVMVMGIVFFAAVGNVYFRDLEHIVGVLVTMWFFLTPVLYPLDLAPANVQHLFAYNPAAPLMDAYRRIFYYGQWPNWSQLGYLTIGVLVFSAIGWVVFDRFQRAVAEEI